jgi:hypothetical protein
MKNTRQISDSKALNIFKKIGNFLETDEAHQQVLEIVSEMRLKDVFERYQHIIESSWSDPCGIFFEENYKSILDFYKENIPKYTGENFPPSNIDEFPDKANLFVDVGRNPNVRSIDNYLRKFEGFDLCFDLNEDKLVVCKYDRILFTSKIYHNLDSFVKMDVLSLFNFTSISSIKNIHKYYCWVGVEHLIRYVSELITVEEFASGIIAAMKKVLSQLIELWVNPKSSTNEESMMYIFPPNFYSKDEIIGCFVKNNKNFNDLINSDILENLLDPQNKNNSYLKSILEEGISIDHLSKEQFFNLVIMLKNKFKIGGYSELTKKEKLSAAFDYFDDYDQLNLENKKTKPVSLSILREFYTENEIFELAKENIRQVIKIIGESDEDYKMDNLVLCLRDGGRKKRVQFLYSTSDENRTLRISEKQLSELKAEFIPMLEKIQDKICYKFNNMLSSFDPLIDTAEGFHKAIIKNNSSTTFGDLFKLLDWYPKNINVLVCADMTKDFSYKIESCSLLSDLINLYGIDTKITLLLPEKFGCFYKENKDKIGILLNQMFGDNAEVFLSGFEEHTEKIKSVCSRTNNSSRDLLFNFEVVK